MKAKYDIFEMNDNLGMDYIETRELSWGDMVHKSNQGYFCAEVL